MKYGSKHEAKQWAYERFRGKLVSTIPTPFDEDLEVHEKDLRSLVRYVIDVNRDPTGQRHLGRMHFDRLRVCWRAVGPVAINHLG